MLEEEYLRVRVIKVPNGPAPYEVREQWLGEVLPAECNILKEGEEGGEKNFLTGDLAPARKYVRVFKDEALRILEKKSPTAAAYFRKNFPQEHPRLSFGLDEVEIIEKVRWSLCT